MNKPLLTAIDPLEPRRLLSSSWQPSRTDRLDEGVRIDVPYARATTVRDVSGDIYSIVRENNVPAGAGGVIKGGNLAALGASGKRSKARKERVTTDDRFHLGSAGKAMTSTMVARLIESGKLDWETRIIDVYQQPFASE